MKLQYPYKIQTYICDIISLMFVSYVSNGNFSSQKRSSDGHDYLYHNTQRKLNSQRPALYIIMLTSLNCEF